MKSMICIFSLILLGFVGMSFAEPLDDIDAEIISVDNSNVSVRISWNHDVTVAKYEVGCVSCMPNTVETTLDDNIILQNISTLDDGHAILYVVALDTDNEIVTAQQVFLLLK